MLFDQQSRNGSKGRIAGRGTAMTTKTSTDRDVYCFKCKECGHTKRSCTKFKPRAKPDGAANWCSVHRTTSHSDEECYSQGARLPNKTASVPLACVSYAHCSSGNNKYTADTTAAAQDNELPDSENPMINFAGSNNDTSTTASCSQQQPRDDSSPAPRAQRYWSTVVRRNHSSTTNWSHG